MGVDPMVIPSLIIIVPLKTGGISLSDVCLMVELIVLLSQLIKKRGARCRDIKLVKIN